MTGRIAGAVLALGVLLVVSGCAATPAAPALAAPAATRFSSSSDPGATGTITVTATLSPAPSSTQSTAAAAPIASPSATTVQTEAPTAGPTGSTSASIAYPGLQGSIGFGRIGQLTTAMTIQQVKTALRSPVRIDYGNPQCLGQSFEGADGDQGGADSLVTALATRHGAHGPVDVLLMGTGWGAHDPSAAVVQRLPRTAEGIGLGSPVSAVQAAYPDAVFEPGPNADGRRARITDGHGRSIVFVAAGSGTTVTMIGTGDEQLTPADDGCG